MKIFTKPLLAACAIAMTLPAAKGANYAWPEKYEGVMLQGFYWDSYTDTKWTNLEAQADELSQNFKLIWIPNSGYCGGGNNMGYMPQYWFTNHNSSFGSETELRKMINTFKEKGTGIIADVVVNHRVGTSNWTNFPVEKWNGQTWQIGPEGICSTDEVAGQSGQARPTGAPDTGDDFNGARDLDHTNANVQNNVKNYCKCLLEDFGYAGFRYDMVKGYGGQYTKIYNEYSKPTYSVGEYWDASYDAVAAWIEATGKQSAAFDFPGKYAINDAFASNDMTKLVWKANGTTDQPAGMIHFGYAQYAVTFVDNHDTYRDGNKFNGNIVAANAFILCSPGTPCVFLPHWKAYKTAIKQLIAVRNAVGVNNTSAVKVLKSSNNCYMAEVTGTKGTLVVKIGSAMDSPAGYTTSDIKASGTDYCVWSKTGVSIDPDPTPTPTPGETFTLYFNNANSNWTTPYIHYWGGEESTWPGVAMTKVEGNVWKYTVPAETTGCLFNAGDGDATKTGDFVAIANHIYSVNGDEGVYGGGDEEDPRPGPVVTLPSKFYIIGNLAVSDGQWDTMNVVEFTPDGNSMVAKNVELVAPEAGATSSYFSFITTTGADWDAVNGADRYGAVTKDAPVTAGTPVEFKVFPVNVSASSAYSWAIAPGKYDFNADFATMKLTVTPAGSSAIDAAVAEEAEATPVYYNLQGMKVENPTPGLYIVVRGAKVTKERIR